MNDLLSWVLFSSLLQIPGPKGEKGDMGEKGEQGDAGGLHLDGTQCLFASQHITSLHFTTHHITSLHLLAAYFHISIALI